MYTILGADGREYGPASADQVRAWIKEGRINSATRIRLEGSAQWRAITEFPEFAASLPGVNPPPPAGGFAGAAEAEVIAAEILARDYDLDIGSCLRRGWDLVFANFWPVFGTTLLAMVLLSVASSIPLAGLVLTYVLMAGLDLYFLKQVRGERAELSELMSGFNQAFVPLMLFSIVGQLLTAVGYALCVIPGIYLTVAWMLFTPLLILDKRIDFWPAMELSRKVVTRHWWVLFGLLLLQIGLVLLGLLACCIGVFIAIPIATAATVYAYEDIFKAVRPGGTPPSGLAPAPAPAPANPAPAPPGTPPGPIGPLRP